MVSFSYQQREDVIVHRTKIRKKQIDDQKEAAAPTWSSGLFNSTKTRKLGAKNRTIDDVHMKIF